MYFLKVVEYFMLLCLKHISYFKSVVVEKGWLLSCSLLMGKGYAESSKLCQKKNSKKSSICENADDMVKHLSKRGPIPDYHPVPQEIKEYINQVAQEQNVECGAIYQCPEHPKEIQIIGINASAMSKVITPTIKQFSGYSFSMIDCTDPRHHVEYGGNDIFSVEKYQWNRTNNVHEQCDKCSCGLILTGRTVNTFPTDAYYAVVPAHFVLGNESLQSLLETDNVKSLDAVRQEVEGKASFSKYTLHMHNSIKVCDSQPFPMFSYRQFCTTDESRPRAEYLQFANDLALLKLDPGQLGGDDDGTVTQFGPICLSKIVTAMTQMIFLPRWPLVEEKVTEIHELFPLQHQDTLVEMARQRVCVIIGAGDIKGYLIPCGSSLYGDGRTWGYAVEFVTFSWEFKSGDCGLTLYVQDTRDGCLYPFGMLFGRSIRKHRCAKTIYRAVVLRQAIDEILYCYPNLVTDLRAIGTPDHRYTDAANSLDNLCQEGEGPTTGQANYPAPCSSLDGSADTGDVGPIQATDFSF